MPGGHHPDMKEWTPEETIDLLNLVDKHQHSWATIVKHLPHRTVSSCRNRYQRISKHHRTAAKQLCRKCGKLRRSHVCIPEQERDQDSPSLLCTESELTDESNDFLDPLNRENHVLSYESIDFLEPLNGENSDLPKEAIPSTATPYSTSFYFMNNSVFDEPVDNGPTTLPHLSDNYTTLGDIVKTLDEPSTHIPLLYVLSMQMDPQ